MAAPRPHVDRRGGTVARPARALPGPGNSQAADRTASAAGALAVAAGASLRRAHDRTGAPRRAHRPSPFRREAEGFSPSAGSLVGARALVRNLEPTSGL